jgi:transcriptional regulator with XRE-family HTH domain
MGLAAYIQSEFEARRRKNARYSLRAFARDLDFDHATLSQLIRDKRALSDDMAERLCEALQLSGLQRVIATEYEPIDRRLVASIREMDHPGVRELARILRVSVDALNVSLARLMRLGVVKLEGTKWIIQDEKANTRHFP